MKGTRVLALSLSSLCLSPLPSRVTPLTCLFTKPHIISHKKYSNTKQKSKQIPISTKQSNTSKQETIKEDLVGTKLSEDEFDFTKDLPHPEAFFKQQKLIPEGAKDKHYFDQLLDPSVTLTPNQQLAKVYLLLFEKEPKQAVALVEELLKSPHFSNEWRASVLGLRALAYQTLHEPKKSVEDLNLALQYAPHDIRYLSLRGHIKMSMRDFNGSLKDFGAAIDLGGSDEHVAEFWFAVAKIYYQHKQFNAAANALTQVEKLTTEGSNLYMHSQRYRAMCHLKLGNDEKFLERMEYIISNTTPEREQSAPTPATYIGIRPKNLGDLHIDARLTRAVTYYSKRQMWDAALLDLSVVYKNRKEKYGVELFEQMVRIMNEKYGVHKLMMFSEKPVTLPQVPSDICDKMVANYKHLEKLNGPSHYTTVEMYLWRAIRGELEIAKEGIEASLVGHHNDFHCFALGQLYIHTESFEKAIYNFERMFPDQETDLDDSQIACVLYQLAYCAIREEWKGVAKRALEDIPNMKEGAKGDPYWKELYAHMEKLTTDKSP